MHWAQSLCTVSLLVNQCRNFRIILFRTFYNIETDTPGNWLNNVKQRCPFRDCIVAGLCLFLYSSSYFLVSCSGLCEVFSEFQPRLHRAISRVYFWTGLSVDQIIWFGSSLCHSVNTFIVWPSLIAGVTLTDPRVTSGLSSRSRPIRGQYPGHVIPLHQSGASLRWEERRQSELENISIWKQWPLNNHSDWTNIDPMLH